MNHKTLSILAAILVGFSTLVAQTFKPLPAGEYDFKKVSYSDEKFSVVNSEPCKVKDSEEDKVYIEFPRYNVGSWSYRGGTYYRFKGNVFARMDSDVEFNTRPESIMVLREGNAMEVYRLRGSAKKGCLLVAPANADLKTLKKKAKVNFEAFDWQGLAREMEAYNQEAREKQAAEEKARKEAEAAAIAKARADADLCTPIQRFLTLAPTQFQSLRGELDAEESELEGEDIYRSAEDLPLFAKGLIVPTYIDDNMRLSFRTGAYWKEAEAAKELAFVKGKIDPCFNGKGGFQASEDSGIHFYKKGKTTIACGTKKDWDDDGDTVYWVWLTVEQRK